MKTILLTLSFVAAALARPGGQSYVPPAAGSSLSPSSTYLPSSGASLLSGGLGGLGGIGNGFGGSLGGLGGSGLGGDFGGGYSGGHGGHDQKHVYFYSAPDEHDQATLRINVEPSSARNTKVIFVKAPSFGGVRPEVIAPPSQTEDKTLVYVLVKRPELGGSISIPSQIISRPTKPEVYFIKYRNQHDAEQAVAGGIQEQPVGPALENLGSSASFVRTLGGNGGHGGAGDFLGGGSHLNGGGIGGPIGGGLGGGVISGRYAGGDNGGYRYK